VTRSENFNRRRRQDEKKVKIGVLNKVLAIFYMDLFEKYL